MTPSDGSALHLRAEGRYGNIIRNTEKQQVVALGASSRVIRRQFLTETVTLTLPGGMIGIGLGTLLSVIITKAVGWKLNLSPTGYGIFIGFSMAIGVFFGWYPAMKAANLNPIDALDWE
jgi:putative ABC transport system permease protein